MWHGAQTYMLPAIMLLSVMGALLLLIVCANVSNLVLRGSQPTRRDRGASGARRQSQPYTALAFRREPGGWRFQAQPWGCWRLRDRSSL